MKLISDDIINNQWQEDTKDWNNKALIDKFLL